MALAVDSTGHRVGGSPLNSPLTWSHTCAAGAELILLMFAGGSNPLTDNDVTAASYNSVAGTQAAEGNDGNWEGTSLWYVTNPSSGTNTCSMTLNTSTNVSRQRAAYSISFTGAQTTLGATGHATGSSSTPSTGAIATNSGDILVAVLGTDGSGGGTAVSGSGVEIFEDEDINSDSDFSSQYVVATGSSTTASWTTTSDNYSISYAVVQASGGGATDAHPFSGLFFKKMHGLLG